MMLKQRITKLEGQAGTAGSTVYAWADCGETAEQAIARQFPAGLIESAAVIVFRWSERP